MGSFHNHRQVEAHISRGEPVAPELSRERREMRVHRLEAPQLGEHVLFYEEMRESKPGVAHRQRLVVLVDDPERGCPRAMQMFFRSGPAYDRPPMDAEQVARMGPDDFQHYGSCDLYFRHEGALDRYRGSMLPRACRYVHPVDGPVYAEFDMLLYPDQLWYRDRSLRVDDGSVRGEIDGFSWLLFDRVDDSGGSDGSGRGDGADAGGSGDSGGGGDGTVLPPALARQQGVWKGSWRSIGADGALQETFEATVIARFIAENGRVLFHQTNHYPSRGGAPQTIESHGEVQGDRIHFANARAQGWSRSLPDDPSGLGSVLMISFSDGTTLHEIVTNSPDGRHRHRSAQFTRDGRILRRTLIDEEKVTGDWQTFRMEGG